MIWTHFATCAYAGTEIISIPVYAMRVQIILYALPVATQANYATLAQAYIVNRP